MTASHSITEREQAEDVMAQYPGYGEMRTYAEAAGTEQLAFSWRTMPPGTGGRGSYGHRHPTGHGSDDGPLEEVYFVISGTITFKVDDEIFEAGPQTAVRVSGEAFRSIHNDTDQDASLVIFSARDPDVPTDYKPDFW